MATLKPTKHISECISKLEDFKIAIEEMKNEKQEKFDGKIDRWQESEKGQELQEEISELEELEQELESAFDKAQAIFSVD